MRSFLKCGFVLLLLAAAVAAYADKVDDYIKAQMQWQHIPGLSLAVVKDGKIIKAKGYGLANVETTTTATPETVYKIGSVSKQFLAAGIMLLVQEGRIVLDDKANKYLAGTPETWKDITIRHLLTHTSGLVREAPGFDPFKVQSDADVLKTAYPLPLRFAPGEKWEYSNVGYFALAEILQKISGKPWSEFLTERLFLPAGMNATRTTTAAIVPHRAYGYTQRNGRLQNAENWLAVRPSGAFLSTVLDLARWDTALYSDTILTSPSHAQMWTSITLNNRTTYPYGFGWFLDDWQGHKRIHHDGGIPGFSSDFERFVDDRLSVIVLVNADNRDLRDMAIRIAGFYVPALVPITEKSITDTEPQVTAQMQAFLTGFAQGKLDTNLLTSQMAAGLTADMKSGFSESLRELGPIQSLLLIERKNEGDNRLYRYRATYRNITLFVGCTFNKDNKIAKLSIQD